MTGNPRKDEHIIEAIGRCRIVIRNGTVVEVGESQIRDCPLAKRFAYPIPDIKTESVKANIEHRIKAFGMCTPDRKVLDNREFVGFGASEILSFALHAGLIDAVVLACDGAGTVVVTTPALVQGIGGRMSGLVSTSPYPSVMDRIEANGGYVLDRENAALDQLAGVALAVEKGFRKIAVTVARPEMAAVIRRVHPGTVIFGVHVTGLSAGRGGDAGQRFRSRHQLRLEDHPRDCREKSARPGRYCHPRLCHNKDRKRAHHRKDPQD